MIKPPPINQPLELDPRTGRINSVVWIQWFQGLVSTTDFSETVINASDVNATTTASSTSGDTPIVEAFSSYDDTPFPVDMAFINNSTTFDNADVPSTIGLIPASSTSSVGASIDDILTLYWMGA